MVAIVAMMMMMMMKTIGSLEICQPPVYLGWQIYTQQQQQHCVDLHTQAIERPLFSSLRLHFV